MIEYGLIVALISIVAIITLTTVGGNIKDVFNSIAGKHTPKTMCSCKAGAAGQRSAALPRNSTARVPTASSDSIS